MQKYNILEYYSNLKLHYDYHYDDNSICTETYLISTSLLDKYKALKNKFKNNKLKDNSTVYFSPFTDYPLYKFKEYVNENKLNINRISKLKNEVNAVVINDIILERFEQQDYYNNYGLYYIIDKKYYDKNLKKLITFSSYDINRFKNLNTELTTDYVIMHEDHVNKFNNKEILNFPSIKGKKIANWWGDKKYFNVIPLLEQIIEGAERGDFELIFDSQINSDANQGLEINEDVFNTIYDMVASLDGGNIKIAQELIANLSPDTLKPYLLYLCHNFPILARNGESKNWKYTLDQIKHDKDIYKTEFLQYFLHKISIKYPEYLPIVFKCIGYNLNKWVKKEIIKEITVI